MSARFAGRRVLAGGAGKGIGCGIASERAATAAMANAILIDVDDGVHAG